ncbi:MAG: arginase, partial [Crocinitomicaceae bacterium]|nr:arginase [Crocinitomicaceae bacterium]
KCIIVSEWEYGAGKPGTSKGPQTLLDVCTNSQVRLISEMSVFSVPQEIDDKEKVPLPEYLKRAAPFIKHQKGYAQLVESCLNANRLPIILSGDHSNAVGSLAGFCRHFGCENTGVIWIDAHLDLHSPYTTPSGNIHGMALNASLNADNLENQCNQLDAETISLWDEIKSLKNKETIQQLNPKNIVFIGIRSYEKPEIALAKALGINVIFAEDVKKNGIQWAIQEAEKLLSATSQWYVSFDVDSLDPSISKGTGTPVKGGLTIAEGDELMTYLYNQEKVKAFEITEINPSLEDNNQMSFAVAGLIERNFV